MNPREHRALRERLAATEERLREIESRHRLLIESWAQAVWETDAAGVVVADSTSWRAYTGQKLEEWRGYGWLSAVHPDDRAHAERQWRAAIKDRELVNAEFRLRSPNGGWRWTNVRAAPVLDPQGAVEKWVGMNIDISAAREAEAALRESEAKYRTLFETMSQGYTEQEIVRDAEGRALDHRMLSANPQYERLTGVPLAWALGKTGQEIVPGIESAWIERFERLVATGQPQHFEQEVADLGRWFDVHAYPRGGDRFALLYDDISERKMAELALRESEDRQSFLLRLADALRVQSGVDAVGARAVRLIRDKLALDRVYFVTAELDANRISVTHDVKRDDMPDMLGTYTTTDFPNALQEFLRHPITYTDVGTDPRLSEQDRLAFSGLGAAGFAAVPIRRGSGTLIWAIGAVSTAPRRWSGADLDLLQEAAERSWAAIERARFDEALRDSEARFAQFGKASVAGLWIRDARTMALEYASPAVGTIYGVEPQTVLGDVEKWATLIVPEDRDAALKHLDEARQGKSVFYEFRIRRPSDGTFRWIRNTDFPLDQNGHVDRIGGIAEDVTETKLAFERQGVLLAELQHRVRNIMAMIRSTVRRSADGALDVAEYRSLLEGRLLALARVQVLLTRQANAGGSLRDIIHSEVSAQAHGGGQFELVGPDVHLSPKAVEVLTLALHELATNALKYGALSVAEGQLRVQWAPFERRGRSWLGIDWTETGAPSRGPVTRRGFGSDLIEGKIPYELGGTGRIAIEPGGARCRLEFPLKDGESILETDAPVPSTIFGGALDMTGAPDLTGRNVLVVEDDYYIAGDTAAALRGAGATVLGPCPSEQAALDLLETATPSHAVLDLNLGGGGPRFEIAHTLKARGVPFIFLTGYDPGIVPPDLADVVRLQKPVPLRTIVETVEQL